MIGKVKSIEVNRVYRIPSPIVRGSPTPVAWAYGGYFLPLAFVEVPVVGVTLHNAVRKMSKYELGMSNSTLRNVPSED